MKHAVQRHADRAMGSMFAQTIVHAMKQIDKLVADIKRSVKRGERLLVQTSSHNGQCSDSPRTTYSMHTTIC